MKINLANNINNFNKITPKTTSPVTFLGLNKTTSEVQNKANFNFIKKMSCTLEAKRIQKKSDKNIKLSQELLKRAQGIKKNAKIALIEAKAIQKQAQRIKKFGLSALMEQSEIKDGKAFVYVGNPKDKKRDLFIFDARNRELISFSKNVEIDGESFSADKHYSFNNGKLDTYDEYFLKIEGEDSLLEKSLDRYIFQEDELCEYSSLREAWQGIRLKMDEVFAFKDDKVHYYCNQLTYDYEEGLDYSKAQIDFGENEEMAEYIEGELQDAFGEKTYKRYFKYQNNALKSVSIYPIQTKQDGFVSDRVFSCVEGKIKYCAFDQKENGLNVTYSTKMEI
ncbi:MAG: hypothetical protein IJB79_05150 [Candidatus Gastranaerophilales bacterium]|nr:hypothetical protein [Candidatus Gastranaerophilales bacterium]